MDFKCFLGHDLQETNILFTSCLHKNPNERGLFTQTTSEYKPVESNFYDVSCLLHVRREFSLK